MTMEEIINLPHLPKKKFVFSGEQLKNMTSEEGCQVMMVDKDDPLSYDDEDCDDDELESDEVAPYLDAKSQLESSRREYISLSLNANRDPTRNKSKLAELLGDNDDKYSDNEFELDYSKSNHHYVHKRYRKLASYETILSKDGDLKFEDISEGNVFKRCIIPGIGQNVDINSLVIYNVAMWTEGASDPFDSTWLRRNTIVTDMGQDHVINGLYDLLLTCKKGEWCEAIIKPEAAFGKLGIPPRIPRNASVFCVLEIVKLVRKDKLSILMSNEGGEGQAKITFDDFWQASDEARKRGNHYHSVSQYRAAIQRYKSGVRILETLTFKNEQEENKANQLLLKLYNNMAKSATAVGEPRMALYACKQANLISPHDPKTYWNRVMAWKKRGHHEKALDVAHKACYYVKDPEQLKHFKKQIRELDAIITNDQTSLTQLYKLMSRYLSPA